MFVFVICQEYIVVNAGMFRRGLSMQEFLDTVLLSCFLFLIRWRGSLAEMMLRVDRSGNLREVLDIHSDSRSGSSSSSESEDGGSRDHGQPSVVSQRSWSVGRLGWSVGDQPSVVNQR